MTSVTLSRGQGCPDLVDSVDWVPLSDVTEFLERELGNKVAMMENVG